MHQPSLLTIIVEDTVMKLVVDGMHCRNMTSRLNKRPNGVSTAEFEENEYLTQHGNAPKSCVNLHSTHIEAQTTATPVTSGH